jgi:broad specificity phosphatase PhoE
VAVRLYLIRHADPAYPEDALSPQGHRDAQALARRLAAEGGVDRVYSSPLRRAQETARYTAELLGLPCGLEPWTRELESWAIFRGTAAEAPAWRVAPDAVRAFEPPLHHGNWHLCPPLDLPELRQGFADLRRSSDLFLARHGYVRDGAVYRADRPSRERLAVFCHAGFGLTWLAHLLAIPLPLMWAGFSLAPASVTTVELVEVRSGWAVPRCTGLGILSR